MAGAAAGYQDAAGLQRAGSEPDAELRVGLTAVPRRVARGKALFPEFACRSGHGGIEILYPRPPMTQIRFDPALPVNQKREEIARAIAAHPVVIVCGETGSGKTTQIPKILLEMGRGSAGRIGHTQPRRIAARSVAARIAEELESELGDRVGYKIRFHDRIGARTTVKLMTDGILLAETQGDPELRAYDTIIVDEA